MLAVPEKQLFSEFQQSHIPNYPIEYVGLLIFCIRVEYVVLLLA